MCGLRAILPLALLAVAGPVWAFNVNALKETPVSRLTADETKAFRTMVLRALDETPDGMSAEWRAPRTRFTSKITPQRSYTEGKLRCRETTVEADAQDRFQRGSYTFCKPAKGDWQIRTAVTRPKGKKP